MVGKQKRESATSFEGQGRSDYIRTPIRKVDLWIFLPRKTRQITAKYVRVSPWIYIGGRIFDFLGFQRRNISKLITKSTKNVYLFFFFINI